MHTRARRCRQTRALEIPEQVKLTLRLGGGREERMQVLWKNVLPIGNGYEAFAIGILQAEDHTDAVLFVGLGASSSSIGAPATAAKRGAMLAIAFPAIAMSSVSGSCQSASGSIVRPPRMISVVPAGMG